MIETIDIGIRMLIFSGYIVGGIIYYLVLLRWGFEDDVLFFVVVVLMWPIVATLYAFASIFDAFDNN